MKKSIIFVFILSLSYTLSAQKNPAITSWLQDTVNTGTYYLKGNSTALSNNLLVNCQKVEYSKDFVYITTTGIPSYPTGPFLDGNPSNAENQSAIFKIPLSPAKNTGTPTETNPGNIGIFINGVAMFDYRDGVAWNTATNSLCGGPGNPPCPGGMGAKMPWNRDAIVAERSGFDCSKGHPAMGNYHHHQNPSAFKLDKDVISTICNLYDADGLYVMDPNKHSPLIGFAYDGFPVYGAFAYKNTDGTGGIARMKSSYSLRNINKRTQWSDGTDVDDGPDVGGSYPIGYFREDYEYIDHSEEDYLDEFNGRFCITPEYPNGTYAYFTTVDSNWNSAYPYIVGPEFYGVKTNRKVTSVTESTTRYLPAGTNSSSRLINERPSFSISPNPATDLIAIQFKGLLDTDIRIGLHDLTGKLINEKTMLKGSTILYFETSTLYSGKYFIRISGRDYSITESVILLKE
ncbi:MAG: YHYH protein [Flavobacteriales bacterium]|nr:YHYH protein [Flavobacteriales bacterium]